MGHLLATRPLALPKVTPVATARTEALAAALRKRGQSKLRGALPPARWAAVGAVVLSGTVAAVWFLVVPGGAPRSDGATEQPSPRSAVTDDSPRPGAVPPALIAPSEAGLFDRAETDIFSGEPAPQAGPAPLPGIADPSPTEEIVTVVRDGETYLVWRVREGETLSQIAQRFGTSTNLLATLNHLVDPDVISVDQRMLVPLDLEQRR